MMPLSRGDDIKMMTHQDVGANLRKLRKKLNMSRPQFGAFVGGYTKARIEQYEKGNRKVPLDLVLALRQKGFPVTTLLGPEQEPAALTEVIEYLSSHAKTHKSLRQLATTLQHMAESLSNIVDHDEHVIRTVLAKLDMSKRHDDES